MYEEDSSERWLIWVALHKRKNPGASKHMLNAERPPHTSSRQMLQASLVSSTCKHGYEAREGKKQWAVQFNLKELPHQQLEVSQAAQVLTFTCKVHLLMSSVSLHLAKCFPPAHPPSPAKYSLSLCPQGMQQLGHGALNSWSHLNFVSLSMQLCPQLCQHLLILISSLQVLPHVLLRCLLQVLFHCFVLLACRGMSSKHRYHGWSCKRSRAAVTPGQGRHMRASRMKPNHVCCTRHAYRCALNIRGVRRYC